MKKIRIISVWLGGLLMLTTAAQAAKMDGMVKSPKAVQKEAVQDPPPSVEKKSEVIKVEVKDTMKEVATPSGLKYIDTLVGTGESPTPKAKVTVHYTGTLMDGSKFDSSVDRGQPFQFTIGIGRVIKGWDEGVMSMKVGGKRTLIIPSDLAYGKGGRPPVIPPDSTLKFDVELIGVETPKKVKIEPKEMPKDPE